MTPVLYAQSPTDCPYAYVMPYVHLESGIRPAEFAALADQLKALPDGHRPIRFPEPQRDPDRTRINLAGMAAAFDAAGVRPTAAIVDREFIGAADPRSKGRALLRDSFLSPWSGHFPGVPASLVGLIGCDPVDAEAAPEANGHPGTCDPQGWGVQSPYGYGGVGNHSRNVPAYATAIGVIVQHLARIHAAYKQAERAGLPAPTLWPWTAPYGQGVLGLWHWRSLLWHLLLRCGPVALLFNGDLGGGAVDKQITLALDVLSDRTSGGEWAGPLGLRVRDRIVSPATRHVVSHARLSDGSVVTHVTFAGNDTSVTLAVPGTNKTTVVSREPGTAYGWGRIAA